MNDLYNIKSAYPLVQQLYDVDPDPDDFEDIAMVAWERIGNKHTRLYRFIGNTTNHTLKLPCNVCDIESVHIPINDAQYTSNQRLFGDLDSLFIEGYIDAWNFMRDPFNQRGKLLKYDEGKNELYFSRDYHHVMVVYHGIIADEDDGTPLVNEKERQAIAAYVAYVDFFKDALKKRDRNSLAISQTLKEEWLRRCNAARIPFHLSQNDMNAVLDVKYRWDRKWYGKSLKPIL